MTPNLKSTLLYRKALGCLLGGLIGDAMGTPTEGKSYDEIVSQFGWVADFECDGTDDTVMKNLLAEALICSKGYATLDDWAQVWLDQWEALFGAKQSKFFISVLHTAQKLRRYCVPRQAALGNMPSSSSAMCISPVGIVNACNPQQAALQAYNLASLIHTHEVGFCQDGAACMAAAVAEAFKPEATVDSILVVAQEVIAPLSGRELRQRIEAALDLARETRDFATFREEVYRAADRFFCRITCDSRETIPLTLALFYLANGDVERGVAYGANLGRDADTIASMCGALAGALRGAEGIKAEWREKAMRYASVDQEELAASLVATAFAKHARENEAQRLFTRILQ